MSLSVNINKKANFIWSIADKLAGPYKLRALAERLMQTTIPTTGAE
jgi:hypothetical protein